jgi:hypothetical protein
VESELTKIRSCESSARPTGLKQLSGHFELSGFMKMSVAATELFEAATGDPNSKEIEETL